MSNLKIWHAESQDLSWLSDCAPPYVCSTTCTPLIPTREGQSFDKAFKKVISVKINLSVPTLYQAVPACTSRRCCKNPWVLLSFLGGLVILGRKRFWVIGDRILALAGLALRPENWPKNLISFSFCALLTWLTLRTLWAWFLPKASAMRVTIPLDISTRPFMPLPLFFRSCRVHPLLTPFLVLFPHRLCLSGTWCNVDVNRVSGEGCRSGRNDNGFFFLIFPGAYECCNVVLSWRCGKKIDDYVLYLCSPRFKW